MKEYSIPLTLKNYKHINKYISLAGKDDIISIDFPYLGVSSEYISLTNIKKIISNILSINNKRYIKFKNIPYCLIPELDYLIYNTKNKNKQNPKACKNCKYIEICGGTWKNYQGTEIKNIPDIPNEIVIETTSRCNNNCDYCFNSFKKNSVPDLSYDKIKSIIDNIAKLKIKNIRFTGGEVLLRNDIDKILKYAKSKKLNTRLNTNGKLLTKERLESIESNLDYILISFNSLESKHSLEALSIASNSKINTIICGTIAFPKNINILEEFHSELSKINISGWELYRPIQKEQLSKNDISLLFSKLKKFNYKFPLANAISFCSYNENITMHACLGAKYDDGHSRMVIDPKGYFKPSYVIDINLGNFDDIIKAWNHKYMKDLRNLKYVNRTCKSCSLLMQCKGGSRFFSKQEYGTFLSPDPLMNLSLNHMVIKPTMNCPGNCVGCQDRQKLYQGIKNQKLLSLSDWKRIIKQAKKTGLKKLTISGGEPTLYKDLYELINYSKKLGITTLLNTTGLNLDTNKMLESGLDGITFSLESLNPENDNKLRNNNYTKKILQHINTLKNKIHININTIITKHNYKDLPELYNYLKANKISSWILSYPENDYKDKNMVLSKEDIIFFNNHIQPKLPIKIPLIDSHTKGIYESSKNLCQVPFNFALVLPNGDVHPCNVLEYSHEPIAGNVFEESIQDIWKNQNYNSFRKNKSTNCKYCPVPIRIHHKF